MIRAIGILLMLAANTAAQGPLDADLDRAASRYAPAASNAGDAVGQLAAEAAEHFRNGQTDEAVKALDQAAGKAYASGATGKAFELGLTAAEARRSQGRLLDAARRYRDQALSNPRDPRAPTAHHAACEAMAASLSRATPDQLEEYDQLLEQHAAAWPDSDTAEAASWQRVELLVRWKRWQELFLQTRNVAPEDKRFDRSRELLVVAHAALLQEGPNQDLFESARGDLEPIVLGTPPRWPDAWSPLQRDAAITLARSAIDQGDEGVDYARRLLRVAINRPPLPTPKWRKRAATLLFIGSLAQGDRKKADLWLFTAQPTRPEQRRQLTSAALVRLSRRNRSLSQEADRLRQTLSELTEPPTLTTTPTVRRAEALLEAGRNVEALQLYAELAKLRPDDGAVQVAYATLLSESSNPSEREQALTRWRAIETRTKPSTDAWFDARLARLRLMVDRGERESAAKLLALTQLLAPSLGGERLRTEFAGLSEELGLPTGP